MESVWDDLENDPATAFVMKLRSELMIKIDKVARCSLSQKEVAQRLHITQPRLSDLLSGKIDKFNLEALVKIAYRAGLHDAVQVKP